MGSVEGRDPYEDFLTINKELGIYTPSEVGTYVYALNELYNVTIKKMEEEGTLKSWRGSGTYVIAMPNVERKLELSGGGDMSLSTQIRQIGMRSGRKTLLLRKIKNLEHAFLRHILLDQECLLLFACRNFVSTLHQKHNDTLKSDESAGEDN